MSAYEVQRASELVSVPAEDRWLVEGLWADQAVGVVGGEPKVGKSFLALDLAVAVASGVPCLRRYPVKRTGRVLYYAAEDQPEVVRERLEAICRAAWVDFKTLDVFLLLTPVLRLDDEAQRQRLAETVRDVSPTLLVLDPFARIHSVDENAAAEVAPLLQYLRGLQRRFLTAVLLVHHAKKGAARTRAGQALRGSSELHSWGDSNLYLRRNGDRLLLSIEHRAAPSIDDLPLALSGDDGSLALRVLEAETEAENAEDAPPPTPLERVTKTLAEAGAPMTVRELRDAVRIRTASLCDVLQALASSGHVVKEPDGYRLVGPIEAAAASQPAEER